jgi:hypothetical protein
MSVNVSGLVLLLGGLEKFPLTIIEYVPAVAAEVGLNLSVKELLTAGVDVEN